MKVAVDTNVLIRALVQDDAARAQRAAKVLKDATLIAVALPAHEGYGLGGQTFVSFDKKAVALLSAQGQSVRQL